MEFGLLGPLVVRSGDTVLAIPQGKPRAVLAVLLARTGQVVSADELADLIWNGSPPRSARATLQNHVKRLRRALGGSGRARIKTRKPGYFAETGADDLDLTRFSALCAGGHAAAAAEDWDRAAAELKTALSLWRGPPLVDIPCPLLAVSEVPQLVELRAAAVEDRIDADLHLGRHREVITELQQIVVTERLRERGHALLMLALYRAGRRAEALAAYQAARRALVRELGLEPAAELRLLHQRILSADPRLDLAPVCAKITQGSGQAAPGGSGRPVRADAPGVIPHQLPLARPGFVGRQAECVELSGLLSRCGGRPGVPVICVIGGSAGAGKTALAAHWTHQVADRFPDGQLYVDLCGFGPGSPVSPAEALRGFLTALGIPATGIPEGGAALAGLYRSLLAARRMLILLDNAADAGQARPLLPASPGCLVVITSRSRLTGLATAEAAHVTALGTLSEAEGRELLAHRLGPQRLASEQQAASALVRLCAGLPLALAIAAGRIASNPGLRIATVARQLEDPGARLDALETGDPATSVRSVFSWSYRKLSNPAAHLFRLIGLHGSTDITPPAAASLAGIHESHAGRLLHELTHAHLAAEQADGRFTVHPLLCAYAAEQARPRPTAASSWRDAELVSSAMAESAPRRDEDRESLTAWSRSGLRPALTG